MWHQNMLFYYIYDIKDIFEKDFDNTLKTNVHMAQPPPWEIYTQH